MAIIYSGVQFVLESMCYSKAIGVLWTQVNVTTHKSVFIQFEFKGIQVLVCGTINTATVTETPLLHRVFIKRDSGAGKQVGV